MMPDREKVIRELKAARLFFEMGSNRADGVVGNLGCKNGMKYIEDALELLKEMEAVEPTTPTDESDLWRCGNCNHQLFRCAHQRYCEMCGRQVKWE